MAYKTPGVHVKEVPVFPPSVAEVETAIPAFIGYTEKAEKRGEDLRNKPTRIRSLLEYHELFGGPYGLASITVKVDPDNSYAVESVVPDKRFYLYESMRLFFDNGGGPVYIVSVGGYGSTVQNGSEATPQDGGFLPGLKALEKYDEPTIILFPDAQVMAEADIYSLQQKALAQCARLQDRVGILDVAEGKVSQFRDNIGINNLKYGAAYTPWIYTAYPKEVDFSLIVDSVKKSTDDSKVELANITSDSDLNRLVKDAEYAAGDVETITETVANVIKGPPEFKTLGDWYKALTDAVEQAGDDNQRKQKLVKLFAGLRELTKGVAKWSKDLKGGNLVRDAGAYGKSTGRKAFKTLIGIEKNAHVAALTGEQDVSAAYGDLNGTGWLDMDAADVPASDKKYAGEDDDLDIQTQVSAILSDINAVFAGPRDESITGFIDEVRSAARIHAGMAQKRLYDTHPIIGNMVSNVKRALSKVPPSGAVAGVYATVDRTRGVWKAPANVSLNSVLGPVEAIDDAEQADLNVDATGGKSINAIRAFSGKGTLIWGARTLAGNDNEWRYVPVRRFFNMVEESVKKSTSWAVFEPNAAPLWTKVKSMIENYLIEKWREGALAGATPDDAFFVRVGLGQTMTPQDVLEGRMNVDIGMAAVRPAEFIVLSFSHKMQES